ncbi:MAG: hypothetical protein AAB605_03010 [Patescibacteria group bacterium]
MIKQKTNSIFIRVYSYPGEHYAFQGLVFVLVACVFAYGYFVSLSIMNVVTHKEAIVESDRLQSEVSMLEEEYFALAKEVTPEMAGRLGLTSVSDTSFVRRPGAVGSAAGARTDI